MRSEAGRDDGGQQDREGLQLLCGGCGNRCRVPGSSSRAYACPRCGQLLPDPQRPRRAGRRARRTQAARAEPRAALLSVIVLMAAAAMAIHAGLSSYRAAAAGAVPAAPPPAAVRLTEREARSCAFRERQLEEDLRRDENDYEVLVRLGQLHLQLAERQGEGHGAHLRRARHYLLLAGMQAEFRSDAYLVHSLLDAANAPNPTLVLATLPGEVGPASRNDLEWIRWRLGALEEQVRFQPRSSRLLRLLADNYVALFLAQGAGGAGGSERSPAGSSRSERGAARRRAEQLYQRAIQCARTHEALCRALYRWAELCRIANEPARAAAFLRQVLRVQPNNWFVSLEMAALSRQLGQTAAAERFQALAARWRTPSWL